MDNITVWETSWVQLLGEKGDPTSTSMSLYAFTEDGEVIEVLDAPFETVESKQVADLSFQAPEVQDKTVFDYYVAENFEDEPSIIYPSPDKCEDGNCELPTITVCPLGNQEGS